MENLIPTSCDDADFARVPAVDAPIDRQVPIVDFYPKLLGCSGRL